MQAAALAPVSQISLPNQEPSTVPSKAFVLHFTEALATDLQGTGVTATALCPGPVPTEFMETAGIAAELRNGPSIVYKSPAEVAKSAVEAVEKGRRVVVPGAANRIGSMLGHYTPNPVALKLIDRFYPVGK